MNTLHTVQERTRFEKTQTGLPWAPAHPQSLPCTLRTAHCKLAQSTLNDNARRGVRKTRQPSRTKQHARNYVIPRKSRRHQQQQ